MRGKLWHPKEGFQHHNRNKFSVNIGFTLFPKRCWYLPWTCRAFPTSEINITLKIQT